jgi:single-stranded-DNA-specific exonuclease
MQFCDDFEQTAKGLLTSADLTRVIETDGDLTEPEINVELAQQLMQQVWGQGFPQPTFHAQFYVESQRVVGGKHLKLKLKKFQSNTLYDAILFFHNDLLPDVINAVYQLQLNEFNGRTTLQLMLDHWLDPHEKIPGA